MGVSGWGRRDGTISTWDGAAVLWLTFRTDLDCPGESPRQPNKHPTSHFD